MAKDKKTTVETEEEETVEMEKKSGNLKGTFLKVGLGVALGFIGAKAIGKIRSRSEEINDEETIEEDTDSEDETEESDE